MVSDLVLSNNRSEFFLRLISVCSLKAICCIIRNNGCSFPSNLLILRMRIIFISFKSFNNLYVFKSNIFVVLQVNDVILLISFRVHVSHKNGFGFSMIIIKLMLNQCMSLVPRNPEYRLVQIILFLKCMYLIYRRFPKLQFTKI